MNQTVEIDFKVNKAFEPAMFDEKPYLVLYGGAGSGKSFFAAQKILLRTINENDNRTLVIMKTGSRLRQFAFQTCLDVINTYEMNELFHITVSPLEILCKDNGNKILFMGLDEPENIKSLPGIKNIWVEEATALSRNDFQQLNIRLRGESENYKQTLLSFNPIDKSSWLYEDFFQTGKYNPVGIYHSTFKDNDYIGDDYEYRIRQSYKYDAVQLGVYLNGSWGERKDNMIYTNWKISNDMSTNFNDYKTKYAGVDFGFNDPNVLLGVGFLEDKVFIFKEFYKKGITIKQFIDEMKNIVPRTVLVIADARSPGNVQEMKQNNIYCRVSDKSPNSIMSGINFLKSKELLIHPDCKNTIEEIRNYAYLYNEDSNTYLDKPTVGNDHCMDTLRYASDPMRFKKIAKSGIRIL
jgi:phage terminase large subunit